MIKTRRLNQAISEGVIYLVEISAPIYKLGRSTDFQKRLDWLSVEHKTEVKPIEIWEVPDLDFCENVALQMSITRMVGSSEKRKFNKKELGEFIKTFSSFIEYIDCPYFCSEANRPLTFICWAEDTKETIMGGFDKRIKRDEISRLARAWASGVSLARIPMTRKADLSQDKYRLIRSELERLNFIKTGSNNHNIVLPLGHAFLKSLTPDIETETQKEQLRFA